MAGILLGTQGWNYPAWVGPFYPRGTKTAALLAVYGRALPTVEIDATFFAIPAEAIVAGWREHAPAGFTFALKVPQEITHERRLVDVDQRLGRFLRRVRGLGDSLGPLLLQMSPDFRPTEATRGVLRSFLASLSAEFRWAIEFRQPQWLSAETMESLRAHRVALTLVDGRWIRRGVALDLAIEPTTDFSYVRWMGPARRLGDYSGVQVDRTRELTVWANALRVLAERAGTVYGYFHNHFQGHAPASVRQMQRLLGLEPVEPAMLREQAELF